MSGNNQETQILLTHLRSLAQKLLCSLCHKKIQKPVTIKCGHHFCHSCISSILQGAGGTGECPTCHTKLADENLISNKCTDQIFSCIEAMLKACKEELKITVPIPSPMTTKKTKGGQVDGSKVATTPTINPPVIRRGRKPKVDTLDPSKVTTVKQKDDSKPAADETSPNVAIRPSRRASAVKASKVFLKMLESQDSPTLPETQDNNTQNKVSDWLEVAVHDAIPTQDRPVNTPTTQSTLISASQNKNKILKKTSPCFAKMTDSDKPVVEPGKDPFEFIPSQPDSIVKKSKKNVKLKITSGHKFYKNNKRGAGKDAKKNAEVTKVPEILLFQSQSEEYIAAKEEKRLKEMEKPIFLTTEQNEMAKKAKKWKPPAVVNQQSNLEEKKMQQKIDEAEQYDLVVEKKKTPAEISVEKNLPFMRSPEITQNASEKERKKIPIKKSVEASVENKKAPIKITAQNKLEPEKKKVPFKKLTEKAAENNVEEESHERPTRRAAKEPAFTSQMKSSGSKKRSMSILIESPAVSSSPGKIILNSTSSETKLLEKRVRVDYLENNLNVSSPGFSRLKKMKSDFKSPGRKIIVPLDVSTNTVPQHHLETRVKELTDGKSDMIECGLSQTSNETLNSSMSSLGPPDLENVATYQSAVQQLEDELLKGVSDESDNEGATQDSTALIENSEPPESVIEIKSSLKRPVKRARLAVEDTLTPEKENIKLLSQYGISPIEQKERMDSPREIQMSQTTINLLEKIHNISGEIPKRKTFLLETNTGEIMADLPSRESTQQQLLSLTAPSQASSKQEQVTVIFINKPSQPVSEPPLSRVKFVKQGKLLENGKHKMYKVYFIKMGYLSPYLTNMGLKYQPPKRCLCGGIRADALKKELMSSTSAAPPCSKRVLYSVEAQTTQSLACGQSQAQQTDHQMVHSAEAQTTQSLACAQSQAQQTDYQMLHSAKTQTTQSLICAQSQEQQTDYLLVKSAEAQTTPSIVPVETKAMQTSQTSSRHDSLAEFVAFQKSSRENFKQEVSAPKDLFYEDFLNQKLLQDPKKTKSSQELFSQTSSSSHSNSCKLPSQNATKNNFLGVEAVETDDEEVTVIEKSQEENIKLPGSLKEVAKQDHKLEDKSDLNKPISEANEMDVDNAFTINSDDVLQATLSQHVFIFDKKTTDNSSPITKTESTATSPMSCQESDYVDEATLNTTRSFTKSRKRGSAMRIASDSESDEPSPKQVKRVSRLSVRKKTPVRAEMKLLKKSSSGLSSDAGVRALVRADLAHARLVAALPTSQESCGTIILESTQNSVSPEILSAVEQTPDMEAESVKTLPDKKDLEKHEEKDKNKNVLPLVGELFLEESYNGSELTNPFLDKSLLTPQESSPSPPTAIQLKGEVSVVTDAHLKSHDVSQVAPTVECKTPTRNKQQCEETDSESDTFVESTPKQNVSVKQITPSMPRPAVQLPISLVCSGLPADCVRFVDKFIVRFKHVKHSDVFNATTSHVIVPYEESKCTNSTLKFLLAVASGRWIVSINWIKDCLAADKILPEEPYEMLDSNAQEGPRMSRLSDRRLFADFEFHCADTVYKDVNKKQLEEVISLAGGKLIAAEDIVDPLTRKYRLVVTPTEDIPQALQTSAYPIVLLDWVIECIESFRLSNVCLHLLRSIDDQLVSEMGFPQEMLEGNEDETTSYTSTNVTNTTTQLA